MMAFGFIALGGFLLFVGVLIGSTLASGAALNRMEQERFLQIASTMENELRAAEQAAAFHASQQ